MDGLNCLGKYFKRGFYYIQGKFSLRRRELPGDIFPLKIEDDRRHAFLQKLSPMADTTGQSFKKIWPKR